MTNDTWILIFIFIRSEFLKFRRHIFAFATFCTLKIWMYKDVQYPVVPGVDLSFCDLCGCRGCFIHSVKNWNSKILLVRQENLFLLRENRDIMITADESENESRLFYNLPSAAQLTQMVLFRLIQLWCKWMGTITKVCQNSL